MSHGRRTRRSLIVAAVVLATAPVAAAPASANPTATESCVPAGYTAQADAGLLKVSLLDLKPLGLDLPKVLDLSVATSKATLGAKNPIQSTAAADYLDAEVLGLTLPRGPLDVTVSQQAPPSNQAQVKNTALAADLGLAKLGTGDLTAHARWADGMTCGKQSGPAGAATAALVEAAILPGSKGALIEVYRNISSQAATALVQRDGRAVSAAAAEISLSSLEIAGGKVSIRVISAPQLTVYATGRKATSEVDYRAPVLEISGPSSKTQRLSNLGDSVDLELQNGLLGSILGGLRLTEGLGLPLQAGQHSLLRISLGELTQQVTDQQVSASAASLRLQLLASGSGTSRSALADISLGQLKVSAAAPQWADTVPVDKPDPCGTTGCTLPVTGVNASLAAGTGILLFVIGRFLMVTTRNRRLR
jgi:hypothetical protein